jgi:hypothetical protein
MGMRAIGGRIVVGWRTGMGKSERLNGPVPVDMPQPGTTLDLLAGIGLTTRTAQATPHVTVRGVGLLK